MCLAIYKPKGLTVPKEHLMAGYEGNRSGCGFMYHENGQLHIVKGLMNFTDFYKLYKPIEKDHDVGIHFRMATHGPRNNANCHPFSMVDGRFALIHNGVFRIPLERRDLSDTGNFCHFIMEPAIREGYYRDIDRMESHPNWGWGMAVLMSADGEVIIYNENHGNYDKGVWYSNGGYRFGRFFTKSKEDELTPYPAYDHSMGHFWEGEWD